MKKIKYALLALLAIFTVVVTSCKNPEDQTANTEQGGNGSGDESGNSDADDDEEANMPDLFTMTAEPCDQGIRVTVSYTELAGGEYLIKNGNIFENNSKFNIGYPETLNTSGTATFVFPFTESGKEYSFGIGGDYYGKAYSGWFTKTLVTCTATTTTAEATWYENNKNYFTGYNVDCNFDGSKITLTRDFPTVKDMDESSALAKIKEMKDSVLNFAGSITKVEKKFNQFVYGYVNYDPKADWQGSGSQELTSDDIALTETAELDSWCYYVYGYSPSTFIENGYDGRYAGSYAYKFTVGSDVWTTFDTWSDQEYYYLLDTTNTVSATSKETTRVLHAVYDDSYGKYIVKNEEHKTVASGISINDLALSGTALTATALVEGEDYVAVLYKTDLKKITSVSDFEKDPLYLKSSTFSNSKVESGDGYSTTKTNYDYLYLENGKLYRQSYNYVEKTYTDTSKDKETYWEKDLDKGKLTEYSFKDGKISEISESDSSAGFNFCKIDDTYFIYNESYGFEGTSGRGLYSTFGDTDTFTFTFKEDGTCIEEFAGEDGNTQSYSVPYKNNNGLISICSGTTEQIFCYYDGTYIHMPPYIEFYEEVSGLPTVTETTE